MSKQVEFNVEYSPKHELVERAVPKPAGFEITSDSIRQAQNVSRMFFLSAINDLLLLQKVDVPKFKVSGNLGDLCCIITTPFSGEVWFGKELGWKNVLV